MKTDREIREAESHRTLISEHPEDAGCTDFVMPPNADSIWITVENISVNIRRQDEGVGVTLYPKGHEDEDCLGDTWALYQEAEDQD